MTRSRAQVGVTTFPTFASLWLVPRLPDFERAHPDADLRIAASDRLVEVEDIELDVALARLAMVHEALARGDLVEPFGPSGRRWAEPCYWLVPLGGAVVAQRPEVRAFSDWVLAQAALTRVAIGDVADPELDAHVD